MIWVHQDIQAFKTMSKSAVNNLAWLITLEKRRSSFQRAAFYHPHSSLHSELTLTSNKQARDFSHFLGGLTNHSSDAHSDMIIRVVMCSLLIFLPASSMQQKKKRRWAKFYLMYCFIMESFILQLFGFSPCLLSTLSICTLYNLPSTSSCCLS